MFKVRVSLASLTCVSIIAAAAGCTDGMTGQDAADDVTVEDAFEGDDTVSGDEGAPAEALDLEKPVGIALAGEWEEKWNTLHNITSGVWIQKFPLSSSRFEIVQFDNGATDDGAGWAVARNHDENEFSPGLYSRFDWTWYNDAWYFCNTVWDKESAQVARDTPAADDSAPDTSGCGGFAWTKLDAKEHFGIRGVWKDTWGTSHSITDSRWTQKYGQDTSLFWIHYFDNTTKMMVAQNDTTNAFNPNLWSRFDWTEVDGVRYFCHTAFDAASVEDAANALAPDATDPVTGGCGGYPWTPLTTTTPIMDEVIESPGATFDGTGDPANATNGVRGGGATTGGTDIFSIGISTDRWLVLRVSDHSVQNGPGPDLVVFENAFNYGDDGVFMDQTVVQVSRDGMTWVTFPFDYIAADETTYSTAPGDWSGFAGISPVLLNQDTAPDANPFDAATAGGDRFDLDDLPETDPDALAIINHGFTYIRLLAAAAVLNLDTDAPFAHDPIANGPDIDGIAVRHVFENP